MNSTPSPSPGTLYTIIMKITFSILLIFYSGLLLGQTPNSVFLIPKNYKGLIYIFLNFPNADTLPFIDNIQIYNISKDGILITKSNSLDQSISSFYYVDSLGNRQEINRNCDNRPKKECTTEVKVDGATYEYHQSKSDKHPLQFLLLSVTDKASRRLINSKAYNLKMSRDISKKLKRQFYFEYRRPIS